MKSLYFIINFGAFIVPFLFSFHPKILFYKKWKFLFPAIFITALIFILWDVYFTELKIWGFNPSYIYGVYFCNLPLEEMLFFIAIPYSCVFTYHCFKLFLPNTIFRNYENSITNILLILLFVFGVLFYNRLYTSVTFFALLVFVVFLKYIIKINWLNRFYFTYLILLVPFLIVNGILTGAGLEHPIVWYNNDNNIGLRLLTIPIEDVFYGMLLVLVNVSLYEFFSRKEYA